MYGELQYIILQIINKEAAFKSQEFTLQVETEDSSVYNCQILYTIANAKTKLPNEGHRPLHCIEVFQLLKSDVKKGSF